MVFKGLGAYEGRLLRGAHRLTTFNAVGEAKVMVKMGGRGNPAPGVVMARSGGVA